MKRPIAIVAALSLSAAAVGIGLATSQPATAASAHQHLHLSAHGNPPGTLVTAGSTWTFYDMENGRPQFCEVLYPKSKKFTSDAAGNGDAGKWKGSSTFTSFTFTAGIDAGYSLKLTWTDDGYWDGNAIAPGTSNGPMILDQGVDPLSWGGC